MKVIVCQNYEEMSRKGFEEIKSAIDSSKKPVVGLATGSTPVGLYKCWVEDFKQNKTSYKNLVTFNLDEYVGLPADHAQSYRTFMCENLFNHIDIDMNNVHLPVGNGDLDAQCKAYDAAMSETQLDVQLLGIGRNGHIGFNEPGTPFNLTTHVVTLDEKTIADNARFFDGDESQVPTQAVTMGIASIMKSKKIVLMATGESKADAIYEMIHGQVSEQCPATALQNHPNVVVILDQGAASKL